MRYLRARVCAFVYLCVNATEALRLAPRGSRPTPKSPRLRQPDREGPGPRPRSRPSWSATRPTLTRRGRWTRPLRPGWRSCTSCPTSRPLPRPVRAGPRWDWLATAAHSHPPSHHSTQLRGRTSEASPNLQTLRPNCSFESWLLGQLYFFLLCVHSKSTMLSVLERGAESFPPLAFPAFVVDGSKRGHSLKLPYSLSVSHKVRKHRVNLSSKV